MNRTIKTFLLLLLMAALPLQGAASTMRVACAPSHQLPLHVAPAAHHDDGGTPAKASHASFDTTANASSTDDLAHAPATPDPHQHPACCVGGTAPPSPAIFTPPCAGSELVFSARSPLLAAFIPAGPERPPNGVSPNRRSTSSTSDGLRSLA